MKTIKLTMIKNEIDISSYKENKFPNREDIENKIAKKLKKPLSEIKKNKTLVDTIMNKKMNDFFETKIIKENDYHIQFIIRKSSSNVMKSIQLYTQSWKSTIYNAETKTIEIELSYKNRIEYELAGIYHKNRPDILDKIPKYVKHWTTPKGKKEIEFIEKTLESIGKIKIEVYSIKNKKLNTLYIKYKRVSEVMTFDEQYNKSKLILANIFKK